VTQSLLTASSTTGLYGGSDYSGGLGRSTEEVASQNGSAPLRTSFATALQVQAVLASMTTTEKTAMGHQIDDFIVDCEFAGTSCYKWYVKSRKNRLFLPAECLNRGLLRADGLCIVELILNRLSS
jgi:hypothetical protein